MIGAGGERRAPLARRRLAQLPALGAREAQPRDLGGRVPRAPAAPRTLKELAQADRHDSPGSSAALILLEPDLGTVIAIGVVLGAILLVSGTPLRALAAGGAIAFGLALAAIWVEPYRRARLFSFLDPWNDPQGAGYQTRAGDHRPRLGRRRSASGSARAPSKVNYLPEAHTDMIFAVIGEELGLSARPS